MKPLSKITLSLLALSASLAIFSVPRRAAADLPPIPVGAQPVQFDNDIVDWDGPIDGPAIGQGPFINGPGVNFGDEVIDPPDYQESIEETRENLTEALAMERSKGMSDWAWRDAVEDKITALGKSALPVIRSEMSVRHGFELDALDVAVFRIENAPLDPNDAITEWLKRRSPTDGIATTPKIMRVFGLTDFFPHHLFYALESGKTHQRLVIAVAADSMIQPISTDESLAKFLRLESPITPNSAAHNRLARASACLTLARTVTAYQPLLNSAETSLDSPISSNDHAAAHVPPAFTSASASIAAEGHRVQVILTFDATGRLNGLTSSDLSYAVPEPLPAALPATPDAPPPIPE